MHFSFLLMNSLQRSLLVIVGVVAASWISAGTVHARTSDVRTEPPAATAIPDNAAVLVLMDDVRALAEEFQLTLAQQVQVGLVLMASVQELQAQLDPIGERRMAIDSALRTDPIDGALLQQLASEQGAAAAGLSRLEIETLVAVRALLDDSQLMLLDELRALLRDRLSEWMAEGSEKMGVNQLSRTALRRVGPRTGDPMLDAASAMGLSPDQRAAVRSIIEAVVPEALELGSDLAANRQAMRETARNAPEDLAAIDALIDGQAGLFEALVLLRIDATLQILDLLSDGQLALIGHLAPVLREHMGGWGGDL